MLVVGLMSGTSMDGITAALVSVRETKEPPLKIGARLLEFHTYPYPQKLRQRLLTLAESGTIHELCRMNFYLGELLAQAALNVIEKAGKAREAVQLIGSHGQTICHLPGALKSDAFSRPSTLQIGDLGVIAERTGITTVGDFRPRDMAAGGEGAPLIPYADYVLFSHQQKSRVMLNIGGIANVTYLGAGRRLHEVVAWDTGPGNMVIDGVIRRLSAGRRHYDRNGRMAAKGKPCGPLLDQLLSHPFIARRPPKTTGREEFGERFLDRLMQQATAFRLTPQDLLATVTAFTADAIHDNCRSFLGPVDEMIISGGGARNETLVQLLRERFQGTRVTTTQQYGIPVEAKEALGFAILAYQALRRRANNVPSATGARHPVVMGKIAWGRTPEDGL